MSEFAHNSDQRAWLPEMFSMLLRQNLDRSKEAKQERNGLGARLQRIAKVERFR